jgi:hypothetical protein
MCTQIQVRSHPGSSPEFLTSSIILSLEMVGAGVSKPDLGFCKHSLAFLTTYFYFLHVWKEKIPRRGPGKQAALRSPLSSSFLLLVSAFGEKASPQLSTLRILHLQSGGHSHPEQGLLVVVLAP